MDPGSIASGRRTRGPSSVCSTASFGASSTGSPETAPHTSCSVRKTSSPGLAGRLGALEPRPRINLTRHHGVFAPSSPMRGAIVPTPASARRCRKLKDSAAAPSRCRTESGCGVESPEQFVGEHPVPQRDLGLDLQNLALESLTGW